MSQRSSVVRLSRAQYGSEVRLNANLYADIDTETLIEILEEKGENGVVIRLLCLLGEIELAEDAEFFRRPRPQSCHQAQILCLFTNYKKFDV